LMHVLRNIDREAYQFDFLVHVDEIGPFEAEADHLGARIFRLPAPSKTPLTYGRRLKQLLRKHGPYDVVHGHNHFFSGYLLRVAASQEVPVRIAHSHNDSRALDSGVHLARKGYLRIMQRWILKFATEGLACSPIAAAALFGEQWQRDPRWKVLQ